MIFSQVQPRSSSAFVAASGEAVAALTDLRLRFPRLIDPPKFVPRTRGLYGRPAWLLWLRERLTGRLAIAALAAIAFTVATAVPTWAALQPAAPAHNVVELRSSAGVTGTATSRLENIGAATFLQQLPLAQHERLQLAAVGGTGGGAAGFLASAREASIARFGESLGTPVMLTQLDSAIQTKQAAAAYMVAAAEHERRVAEREAAAAAEREGAAARAAAPPPSDSVAGASVSPDGSGSGSTVSTKITYYDCVPDGFCGAMSSGQQVFAGAAACSYDLALGTRFTIAGDPTGRTYVCLDRGAVPATWVDIWFYYSADGAAWQSSVGNYGELNIVP